jgi:hypothetical protein
MSMDLKEFFMELEISDFFTNIPYLGSISMLSNKDISFYELDPINRDIYMYIKNVRNYGDLTLGEKYNVIFLKENPKDYLKTDVEVDYLTLKKGDNIGIMPDGRGGIVRLKFKDKVPEITKVLKQDGDEKYDKEKHSFLYFTTQEVIDKILEELDKQESV